MQPPELQRAVAAAISTAQALGLQTDDAVVLQNSNKLALHLRPCDAFARVAPVAGQVAQFEVELAGRLAEIDSPAAALDPIRPRLCKNSGDATFSATIYPNPAPQHHSAQNIVA